MLIKIGNAVVSTEDVLCAWIAADGKYIEVAFRSPEAPNLQITSKDTDADLAKLEGAMRR